MENNVSQDYAPHIVGNVVSFLGKGLFDDVRRRLSSRRQEQRGDCFLDQSRELLRKNLKLMPFKTQEVICDEYDKVREMKECLENESTSILGFQKLRTATKFKHLAKQTYQGIKKASDKVIDDDLMAHRKEAKRGPQVAPGNTFATRSIQSNPFTDSHAIISQLTNESVNDLNAVEMKRYDAEATGEAAAVKDEWAKKTNGSPLTTRTASQSGAPGAAVDLSVHREDGTSSHLVSTPSPGNRTSEDAETRTSFSVAPTETPQVGPSGQ
ncbi:hypothetical protein BC827DRAFT_516697 [Russula dissimulans]|nr:hypothetical protein BC827DRAFT_516697 [Russula dissimulans]